MVMLSFTLDDLWNILYSQIHQIGTKEEGIFSPDSDLVSSFILFIRPLKQVSRKIDNTHFRRQGHEALYLLQADEQPERSAQ